MGIMGYILSLKIIKYSQYIYYHEKYNEYAESIN